MLCRKCPSHASSVTTPTSPRSRCTPSRPTATPTALWIAQPLISWTSRPGPQWRIRGWTPCHSPHTPPVCAVNLPLVRMPFQASSATRPLRAPYPVPGLLSQFSLHPARCISHSSPPPATLTSQLFQPNPTASTPIFSACRSPLFCQDSDPLRGLPVQLAGCHPFSPLNKSWLRPRPSHPYLSSPGTR